MLKNNSLPMLARADRDHGAWCVNPAIKHHVRRQQRANEGRALAALVTLELAPEDEDYDDLADESAWIMQANAEDDARDADEDREPVCYCRRCFLHDDPGGCLVAEAEEAAIFAEAGLPANATYADLAAANGVARLGDRGDVLPSDARYDLDESDLPGWGSARIAYEDFSTGFRVTDRP